MERSITTEGSIWFKRFYKECKEISPYVRFVPIKFGFVRIYWVAGEPAYIHEVYRWMPEKGFDYEDKDMRFESHRYYQEYEDQAELTLKIKNFVEGYRDSIDTMKKRVHMLKNDKEFYERATQAYRNVVVK